jgi:hypothetical protein
MMEQLKTGNIGIGNTSTLATFNDDRFIIVDQKEIFWTGASLKDAGASPSPRRKWVRRSFQAFSIQSARRHRNGVNTARARKWLACLVQRLEYDIICV